MVETLPMDINAIDDLVTQTTNAVEKAEAAVLSEADVEKLFDPKPSFLYARTLSLSSMWAPDDENAANASTAVNATGGSENLVTTSSVTTSSATMASCVVANAATTASCAVANATTSPAMTTSSSAVANAASSASSSVEAKAQVLN